jgi:hypothetical protein
MTDRMPALAVALVLLTAAAAPLEAQGEQQYRLVKVADKELPAEVDRDRGCRESVTRATLTLEADSLWSLRYTKREECGGRAEVENEHEGGRYSMVADSIQFRDDDDDDDRDDDEDDDLDIDDLASGTLAADGTLTARLRDGRTTVVFRR